MLLLAYLSVVLAEFIGSCSFLLDAVGTNVLENTCGYPPNNGQVGVASGAALKAATGGALEWMQTRRLQTNGAVASLKTYVDAQRVTQAQFELRMCGDPVEEQSIGLPVAFHASFNSEAAGLSQDDVHGSLSAELVLESGKWETQLLLRVNPCQEPPFDHASWLGEPIDGIIPRLAHSDDCLWLTLRVSPQRVEFWHSRDPAGSYGARDWLALYDIIDNVTCCTAPADQYCPTRTHDANPHRYYFGANQVLLDDTMKSAERQSPRVRELVMSFWTLEAQCAARQGGARTADGRVGAECNACAPGYATNDAVKNGLPCAEIADAALAGDAPVSCHDEIQNQQETEMDCGGPYCEPCLCENGVQDVLNEETDVDCGGPNCPACAYFGQSSPFSFIGGADADEAYLLILLPILVCCSIICALGALAAYLVRRNANKKNALIKAEYELSVASSGGGGGGGGARRSRTNSRTRSVGNDLYRRSDSRSGGLRRGDSRGGGGVGGGVRRSESRGGVHGGMTRGVDSRGTLQSTASSHRTNSNTHATIDMSATSSQPSSTTHLQRTPAADDDEPVY